MQEFPEEVKQKYRDPKGGLSVVGWSRGIEILEDGKADSNKGSFYANPLHDVVTTDEELLRLYPSYTTWADSRQMLILIDGSPSSLSLQSQLQGILRGNGRM